MVARYFQWAARAPKMGKRLGGLLSQPELIPEIDGNCSGGREKGQGCVKELRNPIKPKIPVGYVSKVRRLLIAGELVVPTSQTSGHAGLQGNGNSRLLGATGRRGQPNSTVNPLETARNRCFFIHKDFNTCHSIAQPTYCYLLFQSFLCGMLVCNFTS